MNTKQRPLPQSMALLALGLALLCCHHRAAPSASLRQMGWEPVENAPLCRERHTSILFTVQGEHEVDRVHALEEDGLLRISFPAALPAYWGHMTLEVRDGRFQAIPGGVPFAPESLTFAVTRQRLVLERKSYSPGEELRGYVEVDFKIESRPLGSPSRASQGTSTAEDHRFKGCFFAVIRPKDFDPLDDASLRGYDLDVALSELGHPLEEEVEPVSPKVLEVRARLLEGLRARGEQTGELKELTWDVSPCGEVSDAGRERVTLWYLPRERSRPIELLKWEADNEGCDSESE